MPQSADDAANNPGYFAGVPYNLRKMVKAVGFANFTNMSWEEQSVYDLAHHGRCMTCEGVLGNDANFIINRYGIVAAYCGGRCHSDMAVLGFLQESHDDLMSAIKLRGQQIPQSDEIPDTIGEDPAMEDDEGEHEG